MRYTGQVDIPPGGDNPGKSPKNRQIWQIWRPSGICPGKYLSLSYKSPYSVSLGICLPTPGDLRPRGYFLPSSPLLDSLLFVHFCHPSSRGCILSYPLPSSPGTSATRRDGLGIVLPTPSREWYLCHDPGRDVRRFSKEKLLSSLCPGDRVRPPRRSSPRPPPPPGLPTRKGEG